MIIDINKKTIFKTDNTITQLATGNNSVGITGDFVSKWETWNADLTVSGKTYSENFIFNGLDEGGGGITGGTGSIVTSINFSGTSLILSQTGLTNLTATLIDSNIPNLPISKIIGLQDALDNAGSSITIGTPANGLSLASDVLSLSLASTISAGAMSAADKLKLDGIATNANLYVHPAKAWVDKTNLSGAEVISNLTIDDFGHPTNWTVRNLTIGDFGGVPNSRTLTFTTNNGLTGGTAAVDLAVNRSWTFGLTGQALALHNINTNGLIARTGVDTVAARTITQGSGIEVTNGDGVGGNPTIAFSNTFGDARYVTLSTTQSITGAKTFTQNVTAPNFIFDAAAGGGGGQTGGSIVTGISFTGTTLTLTQSGAGNVTASFTLSDIDIPALPISKIINLQTELNNKAPLSSVHNPVTIGTANGLSLSTQVLSLALATTTTAGAMSGADKTKLDGLANYSHPTQAAIDTGLLTGASIISRVAVNTLGRTTTVATRTLTLADLGYTGASNANFYVHPAKAWVDKVNLTGAEIISNLTIDSLGHPTNWTTRTLSINDLSGVPTSRTLTFTTNNGLTGGTTALDLSANRSWTFGLTGQALALHNLATNGIIIRTGAGTVTSRSLANGTDISISNADGVSGNPTINNTSTLQSVTTRGATTLNSIILQGSSTVAGGTSASLAFDIGGGGGRASISTLRGSSFGGTLIFFTDNTSGTSLERMRISDTGNLLLGSTTDGDSKLDVNGKVNVRGGILAWSTTIAGTTRGSIHIGEASATGNAGGAITFGARDNLNGTTAQAGIYVNSDGGYGTKMYFATTDNYTNGSTIRMSINHTGEVGIGTATPESYLAGVKGMSIFNSTGSVGISLAEGTAANAYWLMYRDVTSNNLRFFNGSDRMTLDNTGVVTATNFVFG